MNLRLTAIAAGLFVAAGLAPAADWPQWRGLHRDDICPETGLMKSFPSGGPKLVWKSEEAGIGYSGVAVVGGIALRHGPMTATRAKFVFALDTATGKENWRTPIEAKSSDSERLGRRPRCTPTVDGDALYVLGAQGDLACLADRRRQSPLADEPAQGPQGQADVRLGLQRIPAGGRRPGGLLARRRRRHARRSRQDDRQGPLAEHRPERQGDLFVDHHCATSADVRHYVQLTADGPAGFSPKDGKVLWHEKVTELQRRHHPDADLPRRLRLRHRRRTAPAAGWSSSRPTATAG